VATSDEKQPPRAAQWPAGNSFDDGANKTIPPAAFSQVGSRKFIFKCQAVSDLCVWMPAEICEVVFAAIVWRGAWLCRRGKICRSLFTGACRFSI
jgi:hypothetical protein